MIYWQLGILITAKMSCTCSIVVVVYDGPKSNTNARVALVTPVQDCIHPSDPYNVRKHNHDHTILSSLSPWGFILDRVQKVPRYITSVPLSTCQSKFGSCSYDFSTKPCLLRLFSTEVSNEWFHMEVSCHSSVPSNLPTQPVARLVGHDGAVQDVQFTGT